MPINANVTNQQITASVGETKIDVSVSGGVGPTGSQGPQGPAGQGGVSSWNDLTDRPTEFAPEAHSHAPGDITGGAFPADAVYTFSDPDSTTTIGPFTFSHAQTADPAIRTYLTPARVVVEDGTNYSALDVGVLSFSNGTSLTVGGFGNNTGGANGISLVCAVGYELNWQGGRLRNVQIGGSEPQTIYVDSPMEFAGEDGSVTVAATGITYPDSTVQATAWPGTLSYTALTDLPTLGTAAAEDATAFAAATHAHAWSDITSGVPSEFAPSAHKTSHATGGSDALTAADIGAAAASHTHTSAAISDFASAVVAAAPPTTDASLLTQGTLSASRLPTSGVAAGTYTSVTVDTYGRVTAGSTPSIAYSSLTGLPTLGGAASLNVGTTAGTVAAGDHTHAQLHDRSHAITSTSDHTATAWRLFYSNASGAITELTLGNSGQALLSNGASAAPSWGSAGSNSASDLTQGTLAYARMADPSVTSPSQIGANQNNYASFARGINRFTTDAARDITGMAAGADGEIRVLCNVGTTAANTLTIKDENTSSTAANRFSVPWNGDCVIPAKGSVVVFYDGTSSRWRVI